MTDQHPITPPPELAQQLADGPGTWLEKIINAYCVGADQELKTSVEWLISNQNPRWAAALQEARRPKPIDQVAPYINQREPMTINQVKEFKSQLETRIGEMLREFSDKTGLCVNGIELNTSATMGGGQDYWPKVDASL